MKTIELILAGMVFSLFAYAGETFSGTVTRVIDGNTVEVTTAENEVYRLKMFGINCPELGQDYGDAAQSYLEKLVMGKSVSVDIKTKDRWGMRLGVLIKGDVDPRNELLRQGLAWTTEVNPDAVFEALKEMARENGNGLWKEKDPVPPWTYRRQQTMSQVKSN